MWRARETGYICCSEVAASSCIVLLVMFFFFKQKTAYEMRISDWSSDVCSSDLAVGAGQRGNDARAVDGKFLRPPAALPVIGQRNPHPFAAIGQIGRASCRERVCQYV